LPPAGSHFEKFAVSWNRNFAIAAHRMRAGLSESPKRPTELPDIAEWPFSKEPVRHSAGIRPSFQTDVAFDYLHLLGSGSAAFCPANCAKQNVISRKLTLRKP
jgi:hypothetical protein